MLRAVVLLLLLLLLSPATVSARENEVRISLSGIPDGSRFCMVTEGVFPVPHDGRLGFRLTNLSVPCSLSGGEILVSTENTRYVAFRVRNDTVTTSLEARPENGTFIKREERNISAGVYPSMLIEADPLFPDQPVQARIQLQGRTKGVPADDLSVTLGGDVPGEVRITVLIDGAVHASRNLALGGEGLSPEIVSADGVVILSGVQDREVRIIPESPGQIPAGWEVVDGSYRILPDEALFSTPAEIRFRIPEEWGGSTLFIAGDRGAGWEMLPSRIQEDATTISARVGDAGVYTLMALQVPEETPSPTQSTLPVVLSLAAVLVALAERRV